MSYSAAYRLPGIALLAVLGGAGVYTAHHAEQDFQETSMRAFTAPKETLVLVPHNADIEIARGTGAGIRVERRAHWIGTKPSHSLKFSPGSSERIEFIDGCPGGGIDSAGAVFAFHSACAVSYRLQVPADQKIFVFGDAGDVELRDLSGDVTAMSHSGDVDAQNMETPKIHIGSQSGDVSASFRRAPASLIAAAGSGDVSLRVPAGSYRLRIRTSSGDRSVDDGITDDPASSHAIFAATTSGDVSLERSSR